MPDNAVVGHLPRVPDESATGEYGASWHRLLLQQVETRDSRALQADAGVVEDGGSNSHGQGDVRRVETSVGGGYNDRSRVSSTQMSDAIHPDNTSSGVARAFVIKGHALMLGVLLRAAQWQIPSDKNKLGAYCLGLDRREIEHFLTQATRWATTAMDLRQLQYFRIVARTRSFSKAADEAFVAQPAMSQQIQRLERELGVDLFDRRTRPIGLTPAGEHLFSRAEEILDAVDRASMETQEFSGEFRGRIVIGSMQYLASAELPDILADYRNVHPAVALQLRIANSGQLIDMLVAGEIDIAYCHSEGIPQDLGLDITPLRTEELVIVMRPADNDRGRTTITLDELLELPFISFRHGAATYEALVSLFASVGREPNTWFQSADLATAFALVKRGLGVALVPRSVASREPNMTLLSLAPSTVELQIAQVRRSERTQSLALTAFASQASRALTLDSAGLYKQDA